MDSQIRVVPRYVKWVLSPCTWCGYPVLALDKECFGGMAWVCVGCEHFVSWARRA